MISVIIPLYNKERFIGETIQSVLNQSFADFELILINDGSTDKSEAVVKTFNDPRIRYKSIANSGVSVARNTGIELAKFPWIAFLDADDWWAPSFLSEVETAINNNLSKNIFA
ncbi:MAG TPA: glycosyltransferase family 2 protein, partial [Flavobacteriaceae bacterium]|nr:glycosyltransferase family 2 protein [Flavobacteriaceae bacterium]